LIVIFLYLQHVGAKTD